MGRVSTANSGCATPRAKVVPGLAGVARVAGLARGDDVRGRRRKARAGRARARSTPGAPRVERRVVKGGFCAARPTARCVAGKKRASRAPRGGSGRPFAGLERSTGRRGSSTLSAGSKHPGSRARRPGDSGDRGDSPFRILGPSRAAGQIFASNEWRDTHPRRRARARVRSGTVGTGVRESIARHRTLIRGASTTSARRAASHPARRPLRAIWKSPAESAGFLPPSGYASGLVRLFLTEGAGPLGTRASSDRDRPPPARRRTHSVRRHAQREGRKTCRCVFRAAAALPAAFAPPPAPRFRAPQSRRSPADRFPRCWIRTRAPARVARPTLRAARPFARSSVSTSLADALLAASRPFRSPSRAVLGGRARGRVPSRASRFQRVQPGPPGPG